MDRLSKLLYRKEWSKCCILLIMMMVYSSCTKDVEGITGLYLIGDFHAKGTLLLPYEQNAIFFTYQYDVTFTDNDKMINKYNHIDRTDTIYWKLNKFGSTFLTDQPGTFFGTVLYHIEEWDKNHIRMVGETTLQVNGKLNTFTQIIELDRK